METLPDELLLVVFRYLHPCDLIHAFDRLNRRFQRMIDCHVRSIDLSYKHTSHRHFQLLVNQLLPSRGHLVQSLRTEGALQLDLLHPHISRFTNLHLLVVNASTNRSFHCTTDTERSLQQFFALASLRQLHVSVSHPVLHTAFSQCATTSRLSILSLICSDAITYFDGFAHRLPHLRRLSIALNSLERLNELFNLMPSLVELRFSITFVHQTKIDLSDLQLPLTLEQVQIELGDFGVYVLVLDLQDVQDILRPFYTTIKHLTLIARNVHYDADELQNLLNECRHLHTFRYDIRFQGGSVFTQPRPKSFCDETTLSKRCSVLHMDTTVHDFLSSTSTALAYHYDYRLPTATFNLKDRPVELPNLRLISLTYSDRGNSPELRRYFSHLLALAPHLSSVDICECSDSHTLFQHLRELLPDESRRRGIRAFSCDLWCADESFFHILSTLFPNLRLLTIASTEQFLVLYALFPTVNSLAAALRQHCPKLTWFALQVWHKRSDVYNAVQAYTRSSEQTTSVHFAVEPVDVNDLSLMLIWL